MRYKIDHDLHIHTHLSICSNNPEQNAKKILEYAKQNKMTTVCVTDHYWDKAVPGATGFYDEQDFEHISRVKPLPECEGIRFLFGCETDMNHDLTIGVPPERYDDFDFIIVPINHFHFNPQTLPTEARNDAEKTAWHWVNKFNGVLESSLPLHKTGLAHLTCGLTAPDSEEVLRKVFEIIPDSTYRMLFAKAAQKGVGIELNSDDFRIKDEEMPILMKPYRIAKEMGCKFYLGSDAHTPKGLAEAPALFERAIDILDLKESDKFILR